MRLLADVVEIVIRTHMSLARLQGGSGGHSLNVSENVEGGHSRNGSLNFDGGQIVNGSHSRNGSQNFDCGHGGDNGNHGVSTWSRRSKPPVSVEADTSTGAACGWGISSDGDGGSGASSPFPWATPIPIPQQSSCLHSFGSRTSGGEYYTATSPRHLSPLLFRGTRFDVVDCSSGGGNSFVRHPSTMSPSPLSDEQNASADEGEAIQHRMSLRAPISSVHIPVPRDHLWYAGNSSALKYTGDSDGGAGSAAERKGSCMWLGDPEPLKGLREAVLEASRRSPLEPRAAPQESIHDNTIPEVNPPEATALIATVPPPSVAPHEASGPGSVGYGKGRSDWHAVQQAFGSFGESHVPFPSPEVVPTIPSAEHAVSKLPPRAVSSAVAPTTSALSASILAGVSTIRGGDDGRGRGSEAATKNPAGRDCTRPGCPVDGADCCALSEEGESRGSSSDAGDGFGNRQQRQQHGQEGDGLAVVELLGNMQRQIEAMLEQHTRTLEEKIKETEQVLSARLTILETKVHRLELGSPVRS